MTVCSVDWISKLDPNCLTNSERIEVSRDCVTEEQCRDHGWNLVGDACNDSNITNAIADVFLLSLILFLGTFTLAMTLRMFRTSRFFPTVVRRRMTSFIPLLTRLIKIKYCEYIKYPYRDVMVASITSVYFLFSTMKITNNFGSMLVTLHILTQIAACCVLCQNVKSIRVAKCNAICLLVYSFIQRLII